MKPECFCVLVLSLNSVCSQYSNSPCPAVFDFENDGCNVYGKLIVRPLGGPLTSLVVMVDFTITSRVFSNYVGHIEAEDGSLLLQKYNLELPVSYRVHFPVTSPLPKLTAITVNGRTICYGPGDDFGSKTFVTAVRLQVTTFLQSGGPLYPQRTRIRPDLINNFRDAAQVFTYNRVNSTWTTRNSPYNMVNNSSQFMQSTQQPVFQQPNRPLDITQRPLSRNSSNIECGVLMDVNDADENSKSYRRSDLPWLVAIYKSDGGKLSFICAGTLVSNRHVVTAAHCMQRSSTLLSINDIVVKMGVDDLNESSDEIPVTRTPISATIHESFNASTLQNDILVFTLNKRVEFNKYIRPACLWNGNTELSYVVGVIGSVAGWGVQGAELQGKSSMVLMSIVSTATCRASGPEFFKLTSNTTLCAGDRSGEGPCKVDSGGGLYLQHGGKWRLRGIVSSKVLSENNDNPCKLNKYIVFTDTAQYLGWIRNVIFETYYD